MTKKDKLKKYYSSGDAIYNELGEPVSVEIGYRFVEDLQFEHDKLDTTEIYATTVGYISMNHQKLHMRFRDLIPSLDQEVNLWNFNQFNRSSTHLPIISRLMEKLNDAEAIDLFLELFDEYFTIQTRVLGNYLDADGLHVDYSKMLEKCIRTSNSVRNQIMHSDFLFIDGRNTKFSMTIQRKYNNHGKNRGMIAIRDVSADELNEFINYQEKLFEIIGRLCVELNWDPEFIIDNQDKFASDIVSKADDVDLDLYNIENCNFSELLADVTQAIQELKKLDELRKNLKIQSSNYSYDNRHKEHHKKGSWEPYDKTTGEPIEHYFVIDEQNDY